MKKIKIIKSFQTYSDAKIWLEKNMLGENLEIHETSTVKSLSKGRGRIPYGRYHVVETNSTFKSFEKHGFEGDTRDGLNSLVQSGHLLPMVKSGDTEHHMVTVNGRHMVLANINGQSVPFYHSTGMGGKADVNRGQWYPLLGIGHKAHHELQPGERGGVWLNKTNAEGMNTYYGSKHLAAFSKHLDSTTGSLLDSQPQTLKLDEHHQQTYDGYSHPETGQRATQQQVQEWHNQNNSGTRWKYERHSQGPSSNFLGDFAKNINNKIGIEPVHSPEEVGGFKKLNDNASKIISNIENSTTPNIKLQEEPSQQGEQQKQIPVQQNEQQQIPSTDENSA
jgi:hypothetical protein